VPRAAKASARASRPAARLLAVPPLHELSRDQLSAFLYVALVPEETRAIVKELGLSLPGFRPEGLGDVQRCDLVADEIRAAPEAAEPVQRALRAAFGEPPLQGERLAPRLAGELARLCASESAAGLTLWRLLSDRERAVRDAARPTLDWLAREYYGPRQPEEAPAEQGEAAPAPPPPERDRRLEELERALARASEEVEEGRRRGEAQREKIQTQLKESRAREAQALDEAARARAAAESARREADRAQGALAAAQATDPAQEAQRARAAARDLEGRARALEARLDRAREREKQLEAELAGARAGGAPAPPPAPAGGEGAEAEPEEALATWLRPVYTKEFHDSLEGWDRRIQRAAFKQAHLLAQDHRHPSLRAIPLEGLPGYYRVRVATDVRLIYRRGDRAGTVEILSLIDREDLDRYIRQAKTRG
jgi:mRNA-degrading endonuclease RelE of RelBE toxin-antitoxin system